jgi:hypothetical protein
MAACRFFRPHMRRRKLSWLPPYDSNVPSSVNSGAPSPRWLDGNEMVETVGLEPTSACLQNRRADPALSPNNPGIFRTKWCLKMESNHRRARLQHAALPLSYPGNSGADGGNRTRITGVALQGPANRPRPHFEMVGNRGSNRARAKAQALQARSVTRLGVTQNWLRECESNARSNPIPKERRFSRPLADHPAWTLQFGHRDRTRTYILDLRTVALHPVELRGDGRRPPKRPPSYFSSSTSQ